MFYIKSHIYVAFSRNPNPHPAMQYMNPSAPEY